MARETAMFRETQGGRHGLGSGGGRSGRRGRKPGRGMRALMVLGVLLAVGFGSYQLMRGNQSPSTAAADPDAPDRTQTDATGDDGASSPAKSRQAGGRTVPVDMIEMGRPETARTSNPTQAAPTASSEPAPDDAAGPGESGGASAPSEASRDTSPSASSSPVSRRIARAEAARESGDLLEARGLYNRALHDDGISRADARKVRRAMGELNEQLVFSPRVVEGDPYAAVHVVKAGELISRFAPQYDVPWRLIARINEVDPRRVPAGARLKVVNGPFHVIVHKGAYRADLYLGEGGPELFVKSVQVGLGEYDSTPVGAFVVKNDSKLSNPHWTNPRTGEKYHADDPENPLGEHWIGVRGVDENTRNMRGYGLHGTIEPDTIGTQASMGCIRMMPEDIHLVYDCLIEEKSQVIVRR